MLSNGTLFLPGAALDIRLHMHSITSSLASMAHQHLLQQAGKRFAVNDYIEHMSGMETAFHLCVLGQAQAYHRSL